MVGGGDGCAGGGGGGVSGVGGIGGSFGVGTGVDGLAARVLGVPKAVPQTVPRLRPRLRPRLCRGSTQGCARSWCMAAGARRLVQGGWGEQPSAR